MREGRPAQTRREFLHSATVTLSGLAVWDQAARATLFRTRDMIASTVDDRVVDLTIGRTRLKIGDCDATAVTVNGALPAPTLRFREGETAVIRVKNTLDEETSLHWHGVILPNAMDGVPQVTFPGIKPGQTFEYRFPLRQSGTYWYHSHSGMQEQVGVYGPFLIDPAGTDSITSDREYVVQLSDWTFDSPHAVMARLKKMGGVYNFQRRTTVGLFRGEDGDLRDRLAWARMRMDATDIADVTGATLTYLVNGRTAAAPWLGVFLPGERVRLRLINSSAATYFDVRIPGLSMQVVQADGQPVRPVTVDELRIAIAETYDVIVQPKDDRAYTVFAEAMDRSGFALGTLAPREGLRGEVPARRPRPRRSMADMGMAMSGAMGGMKMADMPGMGQAGHSTEGAVPHGTDHHGPGNSMTPEVTMPRLGDPGVGLGEDGRRVLVYRDLRSATPTLDARDPDREIEMHLTGNMERFMWSFDGKKYSEAREPIAIGLQERVRITFVNDTMMEHPIHLHGMWMILENDAGELQPRKHTISVKPAERVSVVVQPDEPGRWALHCHILYHMEAGMFRVVNVSAGRAG